MAGESVLKLAEKNLEDQTYILFLPFYIYIYIFRTENFLTFLVYWDNKPHIVLNACFYCCTLFDNGNHTEYPSKVVQSGSNRISGIKSFSLGFYQRLLEAHRAILPRDVKIRKSSPFFYNILEAKKGNKNKYVEVDLLFGEAHRLLSLQSKTAILSTLF